MPTKKIGGLKTEEENAQALQAVVKPSPELAAVQEAAKRSGADKLTLEEIEAEIEAVRRERAARKPFVPEDA